MVNKSRSGLSFRSHHGLLVPFKLFSPNLLGPTYSSELI